ncbi:MAG TPA: carnitine dehydratase [Cytophagales bacterium]|nr:carnitine dehydratase [Cytophagales bacterium]
MFSGLKVVELASVLAGPSVGQFFAELGAEVIKVENELTGGDVTRSWFGAQEKGDQLSAYFCSVNWGKKSIALDFNSQDDRDLVYQLVRQCDIVIASYKPGDAEKLGMDYDTLCSHNPKIIYGQISGYGSHSKRVGYDAVIQAESGFMHLNGEKSGPPLKMPVALIDVLAGHQLKEGILVAMLEKTKTGKGKLVEVSLIQTAFASLANQASNWLHAGILPSRQGSAHPNIAPYGENYPTKDAKQILVAIGNDKQFVRMCQLLGINEVASREEYASNKLRVKNRRELNAILEKQFALYNAQFLTEKFNAENIPAGIIQNLEEAFVMEEAKDIMLEASGFKGVQTYIVKERENTSKKLSPPPKLGEHKKAILENLKV